MRKAWADTSFRNKNKDFNFTLAKYTFTTDATADFVNSDFITAQTISAENIIYKKDFSFNNLSFNTLTADNISTNSLTANNTTAINVDAVEISSNFLNVNDISSTTINVVDLTITNFIIDNLTITDLSAETIRAETITSLGDVITISNGEIVTSLNSVHERNGVQDISIGLIQTQINSETSRNETQDTSINNLILDVSLINAKDIIQDISISLLGNSLGALANINKTQDVSINLILGTNLSSISTETLTGPGQTTINGNIANTILQGDYSGITIILEEGTSTNFIKQITNISSTKQITIDGSFNENNSNISSRGIDYRLKLKWNGSRWQILDDNYFVNNSNGSIYTVRNVGINVINPQYNLDVSGGTIRCQTLIQTSDERLKGNIKKIDNALNKLLQLRGVYFNYINSPTTREIGFIAQEVETIFPELVSTAGDGIKSVKYQNVTAILVEAIKELQNKYNRLLEDYTGLCSRINL
jgi:hypothetical protein